MNISSVVVYVLASVASSVCWFYNALLLKTYLASSSKGLLAYITRAPYLVTAVQVHRLAQHGQ